MADNTRGGSQDAGDPLIATDEVTYSGETADVQLLRSVHVTGSEGSKTVVDIADSNGSYVQGNVDHDAADAGRPVKIGGRASSTTPTAVTNGDRAAAWFGLDGSLMTYASNRTGTGSLAAALNSTLDMGEVNGASLLVFQMSQATTGFVDFEITVDGTNWFICESTFDPRLPSGIAFADANLQPTTDIWGIIVSGYKAVRARVSSVLGTGINISWVLTEANPAATGVAFMGPQAVSVTNGTIVGNIGHDSPDAGSPLKIGGKANAAAPADVSANSDRVDAWFLRNGAIAAQITAAGALIGGDATNGLDVDVTRLPALAAGTNNIGDVDVLTLPALPAGTNNIGDVDVLTLPALPAGTNNIGDVDVLSTPPPHQGMTIESATAQYTTTQTSTVLGPTNAGGVTMYVTSIQIQAGGTTAGNLQVYFGTGAYSRGTSRAVFDGEFAPSATLKPGYAQSPPVPYAGNAGDELRVTTSDAINPLTVTIWYYLV